LLTEELASFAADKRLTEGGQNPDKNWEIPET